MTIAASCSASDRAGFLRERLVDDPVELNKPQRLQAVRFRQAIDHSRMLRHDPIHTRAWTFQETILPRRLLSFGSREATWECETLRQCECRQIEYGRQVETGSPEQGRATYREYTTAIIERRFPLILPHESDSLLSSKLKSYAEKILLADPPSTGNQEENQRYLNEVHQKLEFWARSSDTSGSDPHITSGISSKFVLMPDFKPSIMAWMQNKWLDVLAVQTFYRYWRRVLVPEYTRRALSKDSDRLIALQAIASDIHSGINDRYLAGLWEGDLMNQLCWQSADVHALPADNQSPSWSWSSIRGPVTPWLAEKFQKDKPGQTKMTIIRASCSLVGRNPCGGVQNGSIVLEAQAMEVRYIRNKESGLFEFYPGSSSGKLPELKLSVPLKLDFSPDTPLGCQADGSLTRSAERNFLNTRHHDRDMSAILLFVKVTGKWNWCVLLCGRVSAGSNTCRRLGIGVLDLANVQSPSSYLFCGRFVLI